MAAKYLVHAKIEETINTYFNIFQNKLDDVVNTIVQENPLANYKDKHRVVEILKEAVVNGNKLETENQHIENIKDMLGTDRIFQ